MMHTTQALYDQLRASLAEIEMQISHVKNDIKNEYPEAMRDKINVWYWTLRPDGRYVLEDLLVAKAQITVAMANLKAADLTSKRPVAKR